MQMESFLNDANKEELQKIQCTFSDSDREVFHFLASNRTVFDAVRSMFRPRLLNTVLSDQWFKQYGDTSASDLEQSALDAGSVIFVDDFRKYGGHTLSLADLPTYEELLKRTHERFSKQQKKTFTVVATIEFRENAITEMLLASAVTSMSPDDLNNALLAAGVEQAFVANFAKKLVAQTSGAISLEVLSGFLGKKVVKELVLHFAERVLAAQFTKQGAKIILAKVAKKLPQKAFPKLLTYLGWALLAKDVVDLGSEATRITVPFVTTIAIHRTLELKLYEHNNRAAS